MTFKRSKKEKYNIKPVIGIEVKKKEKLLYIGYVLENLVVLWGK